MKKRKILAMLMVATLSVGMLAGCGSDDTKEESTSTEDGDTKTDAEENTETEDTKDESTDETDGTPYQKGERKILTLSTCYGTSKRMILQALIPVAGGMN